MHFAIYRQSDGCIVGTAYCQSIDQVAIDAGNAIVECGPQDDNTNAHVVAGVLTPYTAAQLAQMAAPPGDGWTWSASSCAWVDGRTLVDAKAQNQARLVAARDALEYSPVTVNAMTFAADMQSQARIAGAVQMALLAQLGGQPFSIDWTLADGVTHATLDGPGMIAVGQAVAAAVEAAFARWRTAQAAVAASTINSQADAVGL